MGFLTYALGLPVGAGVVGFVGEIAIGRVRWSKCTCISLVPMMGCWGLSLYLSQVISHHFELGNAGTFAFLGGVALGGIVAAGEVYELEKRALRREAEGARMSA
jgi:hypothetical protein